VSEWRVLRGCWATLWHQHRMPLKELRHEYVGYCRNMPLGRVNTRNALVSAGILTALVLGGACKEKQCSGNVIYCSGFTLAGCGMVRGCRPGPGCTLKTLVGSLTDCSRAMTQGNCNGPRCSWVEGSCVNSCETITELATCSALHSNQTVQSGAFEWTCLWVECLGTPEKTLCSEYPVNDCPGFLGCSVEEVSGL
jgi:hypothetical protein